MIVQSSPILYHPIFGEDNIMCESELLRIFKTGSVAEAQVSDWDKVIKEAKKHRVVELLAVLVKQAPVELVPVKIAEYLEKAYLWNVMINSWFINETKSLISQLQIAGIRCIVLKGALLAERLYNDLGVRKSGDIDILVEEFNFDKSMDVLKQNNYDYDEDRDSWDINYDHHIKLIKKVPFGFCSVELHNRFTDRHFKSIRMDEVWKRAKPLLVGNTTAFELAPIDLLLHLCIHSAGHKLCNLRHILDVVRAIEVEGELIDWDQFTSLVKKYDISYRVYASLDYAVRMFGVSIPAVFKELRPSAFILYLINRECIPDVLPKGLSFITGNLVRNEGITGFLFENWHIIFPPIHRMRRTYKYNTLILYMLYPVRFIYFFVKTIHYIFYLILMRKAPYKIT